MRDASMSVEQFWQLWTLGFAFSVLGSVASLLTVRSAAPGTRVRAIVRSVGFLLVGVTGIGLGVYEFNSTPAPILAQPAGGYLTVLAGLAGVALIVICVRAYRGWSDWALAYHAVALLRAKSYLEALSGYELLLARRPKSAAAWVGKSACFRALGRFTDALDCAERAQALAPQDANVWAYKADALAALRRDDEALAAFARAIQLAPHSAALLAAQGYALERAGHHAEALESCERALQEKRISPPVRASALSTLATALGALGRYSEALTAAEQAINLKQHPTIRAWLAKAVALQGLGRSDEAQTTATRGLDEAERLLAEEPTHLVAWETIAALLRLMGRDAEAESAAAHVRELIAEAAMH
jgi:tetratricopeptide (TPR) repeat protein